MKTSNNEHETENAQNRKNNENSSLIRNQSTQMIAATEASAAQGAVAAMQQQSNQETEIAAMLALTPTKKSTPIASTTMKQHTQQAAATPPDGAVDTCFAMPATPSKAGMASPSVNSSSSGSFKKKRAHNKNGKRHASSTNEKLPLLKASNLSEMKTSHSMTSLPPDDDQQERRDVIKAKLNLERPYNSLKKCAQKVSSGVGGGKNIHHVSGSSSSHNNSHHGSGGTGYSVNKLHRYSWGSAYSQSSSTSLHSSATLGLSGSAKDVDDLWAAIQTNYNYIMDTNLLDTCKEARCEIEGASAVSEKSTNANLKMLHDTQSSERLFEDPTELRRWLRSMESKLENVPTISELKMLSTSTLQCHCAEHSVLYDEIVSHARVVSNCIRTASERERQVLLVEEQQQQLQQQPTSLTSEYSSISTEQNTSSSDEASVTKPITSSSTTSSGIGIAPIKDSIDKQQLQLQQSKATATPLKQFDSVDGAGPSSSSSSSASASSSIHSKNNNSNKNTEGNLERLRTRYYLVYLKAFEVQICFDNLLNKRNSTASHLNTDTEDDGDDIGSFECDDAATEDDLNDVVSDLDLESELATQNSSSSFAELQQRCSTIEAGKVVVQAREQQQQQLQTDSIAPKPDCEDGDDEGGEEEDDEDVVDFVISKRAWRKLNHHHNSILVSNSKVKGACHNIGRHLPTLTDFEADSESSDLEFVQNLRRQRKIVHEYRYALQEQNQQQQVQQQQQQQQQQQVALTATVATDKFVAVTNNTTTQLQSQSIATHNSCTDNVAMNVSQKSTTRTTPTSSMLDCEHHQHNSQTQEQQMLQTLNCNNMMLSPSSTSSQKNINSSSTPPTKVKNIAVISPNMTHSNNSSINSNSNKSSPVLRKRQQQHQQQQLQQHRHNDISKFNRSNRKSKNCAIFYFKHLDTDNETNYGGSGGGDAEDDSASASHGDADEDDDDDVIIEEGRGGVGGECHSVSIAHSSSSASHASDILKSAEASSDDDECWLYTANSSNNNSNNNSNDFLNSTVVAVDGLQSATVSSTTSVAATSSSSSTLLLLSSASKSITTSLVATSATKAAINDDSDKENKEALATTSTSSSSAVVIINKTSKNYDSSISSSNSNSYSSSPSMNALRTESSTTTTSTTRTSTTQIQSNEMELQINGNNGKTNNNIGSINKTTTATKHIISNNCYINLQSDSDNNNSNNNNNNNNHHQHQHEEKEEEEHLNLKQQNAATSQNDVVVDNGNCSQQQICYYTRADICNINVKPTMDLQQQHMLLLSPSKRLPPRSPAKSVKSTASSNATMSPSKVKISHDSIKQLVIEAEHLVRDAQEAALKTPTKQKHSIMKISSTVKKRDGYSSHPIKQRVQEWLEHQPSTPQQMSKTQEPVNNTSGNDCEASGEASETDSIPQPGSDTSEGFTDSIATCMQTSTNSYGNSTELIGGSAEPISGANAVSTPLCGGSNQSLNVVKIVKRQQTRRKSERPWSVSCLSQLTTDTTKLNSTATSSADVQAGLASHSISESALDSLSPGRPRAVSTSTTATTAIRVRKYDSKGSLRRRRTRKKRLSATSAGKKTDSGSEAQQFGGDIPICTLMKSCESMSAAQIQDITCALLSLQQQQGNVAEHATNVTLEQQPLPPLESGEEEPQLMKPNFRVGSYTTAYMANEARLGSLAALATYIHEDDQQGGHSTEDHHSSISETAWDNYQEKYNSENYSEGFDSDAARRLMEFGDDYRNFIDSQSDCCSSLSAANNLDSFSPPRMDSLQKHELKALNINQETITSSVDHARRRRTLELEYERRRKTLEVRRKSCQEVNIESVQQLTNIQQQQQNQRSPTVTLSSSANAITPKNNSDRHHHHQAHRGDSATRKLDFGGGHMSHSAQSLLRRTSESDTSTRRRRNAANADERRRSSRNLEKCIKMIPVTNSSSSSCDDSDDEKEMRNLLQQSRNRLEDTRALKIRCHLLRPEDYHEIINTCRDNIRCLEAVLRGPPGSVLSAQCAAQTKDLLAAWEDLLGWSENAAAARKLQEEMIILKHSLNRLSNKSAPELLDTEPAIQIAIEALKNEKGQLQSYRTSMLRLNASVHSWLTRQERRLQAALVEQQLKEAADKVTAEQKLAEEHEEAESEQNITVQEQTVTTSNNTQITTITVIDSNGNQLESHSTTNTTVSAGATMEAGTSTHGNESGGAGNATDKMWDLQTLMNAEQEFHKHLKDEVSDMYSAWDEADARINTQLEMLTNSLIAWRQLECGLSEFQQALGQDRGTLKGLEGALDKGQATPVELAQNVKLVAKLLSEKVNVSQEQLIAVQEHLDPNHIFHITKFTASNGSLSDSGISDGGTTSDGGLSERERRLGVLRRLAKQLESALAPGSDAMKSIAARMESAEAELKTLQNTCRDLIVRTAATHQSMKLQQQQEEDQTSLNAQQDSDAFDANATLKPPRTNGFVKANGHAKDTNTNAQLLQETTSNPSSPSKRKNKRKQSKTPNDAAKISGGNRKHKNSDALEHMALTTGGDGGGDPDDDPPLEFDLESSNGDDTSDKNRKRGWAWRIAKAAVPMQLALFTMFCAACLMQPNCCDNLNNLSMSFTPQLRYIRGPPPI